MMVTSLTDNSLTPQEDYWRTTWALQNSFKHITYPDTRGPCVHCAVEPLRILEGSSSKHSSTFRYLLAESVYQHPLMI